MKNKSFLLGLGFDARDEHKRITKGGNFYIFGGSKETHQLMQESCLKFNEELKRKRKSLDDISGQEFYEISKKLGLKTVQQKGKHK